ncbi:MAG: hypothetical protein IPJ76_01795 [Flavobacteriales bacterium]|nr:MAG: hypothetical protein IPJ76_01795 [Flavobacteriales bacterium]
MKKSVVLSVLLLASTWSVAQDRIIIVPNWNVGDQRRLHYTEKTYEMENDTVRIDTQEEWDASLKVTKSTAAAFIVELVHKDATMRQLEDFHNKIGSAPKYKDLVLRYKVDKKTGKTELENWKEAQQFVQGEFELIAKAVGEEDAEAGAAMEAILSPLTSLLDDEAKVKSYFNDELGFLTSAYGHDLMQRDTLRIVEKGENPLQPGDSLSTTTLMTISSHDLAKQRMVVRTEVIFDMSKFVEMMKSMMVQMIEAFAKADANSKGKEKEIAEAKKKMQEAMDSMEMSVKNQTLTTINTLTSWPVKVVTTARVTAKEPRKTSLRTVTRTVDVRE